MAGQEDSDSELCGMVHRLANALRLLSRPRARLLVQPCLPSSPGWQEDRPIDELQLHSWRGERDEGRPLQTERWDHLH